ncbi:MAG: AsmA family protein [candidate division Zixibacteria bacterium]|nr:AsmA family protein [candidate division Zixibacteria bacterium]
MKKTLLWLVIIVVVVAVLGAAAVALFFPKEKVKAMALERLSSALGRPVTVAGVSISFWGGLGLDLEQIHIANPDGFVAEEFLTAKSLDVKVQFWPMLKKQIQIDRMILVEPVIMLRKLPDGRINYDFSSADTLAPPEVREALPEEVPAASAAAVTFDNLTIENGHVEYVDDSSHIHLAAHGLSMSSVLTMPSAMVYAPSGKLAVKKLDLKMDDQAYPTLQAELDFDGKIDLNKSIAVMKMPRALINGNQFVVNIGIPNVKTMNRVNAQISGEKIDLDRLLSLAPSEMTDSIMVYNLGGLMTIDVKAAYDMETGNISYDGTIGLSDVSASIPDLEGGISIASVATELQNDQASVKITGGKWKNSSFAGTLNVRGFDNPVLTDSRFDGSIDLADLKPFLPESGDPNLTGTMNYNVTVSGPIDNMAALHLGGEMSIQNGTYTAGTLPEPVESFSLAMKFKLSEIEIEKLNARFTSSDISLQGSLHDALPYFLAEDNRNISRPNLTFTMTSHRFDTDKLFPEVVPGETGGNPAELPIDSLPPIVLPDIDGTGTAHFDTLIYSRVEFTHIDADVRIENRRIHAANVTGKVYTGDVTGNAVVDLSDFDNPTYRGEYQASQVEADDFISRFSGFGGHFFGKLNISGDFSASGWDPEPILQSLSMDGNANVKEARLVGFDVLQNLAENLNMQLPDEEKLRDLMTSFRVENGRVTFDAMKFLSTTGDWLVGGSVGFDGSLDYTGEVLLSEKLTSEVISGSGSMSGLVGLFKQKGTNRIKIPFTLGGTYTQPKFGIDLNASDAIKQNLTNQVGDALKDLFK